MMSQSSSIGNSKPKSIFHITHLYPGELNMYGDRGNIRALEWRLNQLGLEYVYQSVGLGDELPNHTDFYFIGGGQDAEQVTVYQDLLTKQDRLINDAEAGVGMLAICGGYQLLGEKFLTGDGQSIVGLGILHVETAAPQVSGGVSKKASRCIGNVVSTLLLPELQGKSFVGFENHSGQTTITKTSHTQPLAKVQSGHGNNLESIYEGAFRGGVIGTYMHGSCLPKNPHLAQWFIQRWADKQGLELQETVDDSIALAVNQELTMRFTK